VHVAAETTGATGGTSTIEVAIAATTAADRRDATPPSYIRTIRFEWRSEAAAAAAAETTSLCGNDCLVPQDPVFPADEFLNLRTQFM